MKREHCSTVSYLELITEGSVNKYPKTGWLLLSITIEHKFVKSLNQLPTNNFVMVTKRQWGKKRISCWDVSIFHWRGMCTKKTIAIKCSIIHSNHRKLALTIQFTMALTFQAIHSLIVNVGYFSISIPMFDFHLEYKVSELMWNTVASTIAWVPTARKLTESHCQSNWNLIEFFSTLSILNVCITGFDNLILNIFVRWDWQGEQGRESKEYLENGWGTEKYLETGEGKRDRER